MLLLHNWLNKLIELIDLTEQRASAPCAHDCQAVARRQTS